VDLSFGSALPCRRLTQGLDNPITFGVAVFLQFLAMASSHFAEFQNSAPQSVAVEHQNSAPESVAMEYYLPENPKHKRFAEHDNDSAPQFNVKGNQTLAPKFDATSEKELAGFDADAPSKNKRYCGLARRTVIIFAIIALIIVVGAVVGGVVATRSSRTNTQGKLSYERAYDVRSLHLANCGGTQHLQHKLHPQHPHLPNLGHLPLVLQLLLQQPSLSRVPYTLGKTSPR
jgi:hypothetical protein